MKNLVVCLGYDLNLDGSISQVLENRLAHSVALCRKTSGSTLLLMGAKNFRDETDLMTQSAAMKGYLMEKYPDILSNTQIVTEETTTSTVEQLAYLREYIGTSKVGSDIEITVVASEIFLERVKLYVEYIFGTNQGFKFLGSKIPNDIRENFERVEIEKLKKAKAWLMNHKKGEYKKIVEEQMAFQQKIVRDNSSHPRS